MSTMIGPSPAITPPATRNGLHTVADLLHQLGDIPADRVRLGPPFGQATLEDVIAVNERKDGPVCEWVDGNLVEKAMGQYEGWVTFIILGLFDRYLETHDLGMVYTPDVVVKILPDIGRAPDVAFFRWDRLPEGKPPPRSDKVPAIVPDLAVEVLSESNSPAEMARKRDEYFRAGVRLVWEIDPKTETANVFTGPNTAQPIPADGILDGGEILPGFQLSLRAVFDRAARRGTGPAQ